ncbi:oligopeptide ABC transporter substrate-binding protein [Paenibacillus polymyxa]|uniref:oligopeptide ABC transporter substrate-binding protein n=1 Tax=Paenibacillus polymyxa TaxID=1406 RepID=UPI0004D7E3EB|nr:oligopeptide ABC transporter substrate-binding protein [Paenibacillus polymyxa]KEO79597.1 ABC transporter substrate-binding protein [Paenibacillus polymyxa]MCH6188596.1 oligopeptide ABC transporter substrate-binding protein [Paenibacillus polymyxa]WRL61479.1 oligopeptide ABC transporter substrate-binding protein [Paenibacillus polymyxa]
MVKYWKKGILPVLSAILVLSLAACSGSPSASNGGKSSDGTGGSGSDSKQVNATALAKAIKNDKAPIKGGIINYALVSDTPFEGILNPVFYEGNPDFEVFQFFYPSMFSIDSNLNIDNKGAATISFSPDNKAVTVKIDPKLNWTDGNPVTAEDYAFSYEVIGHKDYEGPRYDSFMTNIVGMEDYHAGKAKTISGIKVLNEKEVTIHFKEPNPSVKSGLWSTPLEKKVFQNIPVKDMAGSDPVRKNPIGYGPFKIKSMVTGESVEFVKNEDYFHGEPKLDGLHLKVVNPNVITEALKSGEVDWASYPTTRYNEASNPKNVQFLGQEELSYSYVGFKMGKFDQAKNLNIMDPNAKLANKSLRLALGYALNNEQVGKQLYHGLRIPATSLIPPAFKGYHDMNAKGITYDTDKAKKLLDEAGYVDTNGDGYREDPKGKELVLHYAAMSGDATAESLAKFYLQNWKDVGLHVELVDGRLLEFNSFYDRVQKDDPGIDIFGGAWSTGSDIDPSGLYGRGASFNYSRFTSEENDKLLREGVSVKAFDDNYRKDIYNQWQAYMSEEAPIVPTLFRYSLEAVNNRVANYDITRGKEYDADTFANITLTAEKAEVAQ